jgi:uncharacterized protein (TIGR02099 family)
MDEVSLTPTPRLRAYAALARWALWLLLAAWSAVALFWGGLHFLIVPRIGEFRPWVEQQASKALGLRVTVGSITAISNGLIPSVELSEVRLFDPSGREALRLPSVQAALSPRSALGLGFEQLHIEQPELDVRRSADGRFWVAGLPLPDSSSQDGAGIDWLFSQAELAVRHGRVRWTDELRNAPPLELSDVDLVVRKRLYTHTLRLDADPPAAWGRRITVMGRFTQPLLSQDGGDWKQWRGELYAQSAHLDLAYLRQYAELGFELSRGAGALRAWVGVDRAHLSGITADVALSEVTALLAPELQPLDLDKVVGRLASRPVDGGREYATEGLRFETGDGLRWPGGNLRLRLLEAGPGKAAVARGELQADRLDLASLAEIAARLPLDESLHQRLRSLAPHGLVEQVSASWQGTPEQPNGFALKGRVTGLQLAAHASGQGRVPGLRGADVDFDITQAGGRASLSMKGGEFDLSGLFESPRMGFDSLSADLQWALAGDRLVLDVPRLKFANADAQGELQLKWSSDLPAASATSNALRWPGQIELQGSMARAELAAVPRYLPLVMDRDSRLYLQQALLGGRATNIKFRAKGEIDKFPYADARAGELRLSATLEGATYAFAPAFVQPRDSLPWPVLTRLSGDLLLDHDTLQLSSMSGVLGSSGNLQFLRTQVRLNELYHKSVLSLTSDLKGPLPEALALINSSPAGALMGRSLSHTTASGNAEYHLQLGLPLHAIDKSTVQGSVVFAGNELQFSPDVPRLSRLRGTLAFTDSGFTLSGVQARALGGDVRLEGGLSTSTIARAPALTLRAQGQLSAEGLRQASELSWAPRLGAYATGATAYSLSVGLRAGFPEIQLSSSLVGLGLSLPAPLSKAADAPLPLRFENTLLKGTQAPGVRLQDVLQIELGRLVQVSYQRDISGPEPRVLRGAIGVGLPADESAPLPAEGVLANVNLQQLDVDAWMEVLSAVSSASEPSAARAASEQTYLPNSMAIRARELTVDGRKLANVLVGGSREGRTWRANIDANELNGYVEYRQPGAGAAAGRVYARLARMALGPSTAQEVENLLDQQPVQIPALDVVVEDFELRGKKLGRVDIQAVNLGAGPVRDTSREWRLNRFNISTPEASLTASGNWVALSAQNGAASASPRNLRERRRTVLNFKLDINDSGDLLTRFGMPGVIAKGRGKLEGQVAWLGSPVTPDYPSMSGGFNVNIETGQFLKADPGIAKLLGVLSLQSLPRRLTLDFRDVFSEGFAFDFVRGDVTIEQGIARTNNLQMKGVNAAVLMEGQADIARETQLLKVVVIPEINAGSASLIASAINPLVGLTTFLAQVILRRPLIDANTQEFQIDGSWLDPRVTKVERK